MKIVLKPDGSLFVDGQGEVFDQPLIVEGVEKGKLTVVGYGFAEGSYDSDADPAAIELRRKQRDL